MYLLNTGVLSITLPSYTYTDSACTDPYVFNWDQENISPEPAAISAGEKVHEFVYDFVDYSASMEINIDYLSSPNAVSKGHWESDHGSTFTVNLIAMLSD